MAVAEPLDGVDDIGVYPVADSSVVGIGSGGADAHGEGQKAEHSYQKLHV